VWEVVLPDASKLWPAALRRIDQLIDDEALVEVIAAALERRYPKSRRRGRHGTPAEVVLRMRISKHLDVGAARSWSTRSAGILVSRAFARLGCDAGPDDKTILTIANALGPAVIAQLHQRVVALPIDAGHEGPAAAGRHDRGGDQYPPSDGWFAVGRWGPRGDARRQDARGLGRPRDAETMQHRVAQRVRTVTDATRRRVGRAQRQLKTMIPLLRRVVAHTTQRVFEGDTHVPDKVVSLFEPHTTPIRKGKIVTPRELGRLVSIQEADGRIVAAYAVHDGRPADSTLEPLDAHEQTFRKPPDLAVADRGFASAANEAAATARGVRRVVLPRPGPKTPGPARA
jgi:IS5 family transposase